MRPRQGQARFPWDSLATQFTVVFLDTGYGENYFHLRTRVAQCPQGKERRPWKILPDPRWAGLPSSPLRACLKGRKLAGPPRSFPFPIRPRSPPFTPLHRPPGSLCPELARPQPSLLSRRRCEHPGLQPCTPLPPWGNSERNLPRTTSGTHRRHRGPRGAAEENLGAAEWRKRRRAHAQCTAKAPPAARSPILFRSLFQVLVGGEQGAGRRVSEAVFCNVLFADQNIERKVQCAENSHVRLESAVSSHVWSCVLRGVPRDSLGKDSPRVQGKGLAPRQEARVGWGTRRGETRCWWRGGLRVRPFLPQC